MASKDAASKELGPEQDELMTTVLRSDLYDTVLRHTDWDVVLSSLMKRGLISEKRQEVLKMKTKGDAAVAFPALLTRKKSQPLRFGFLLALKESAVSTPNHEMLLTTLIKAVGVDKKSLEEECGVATVSAPVTELTAPPPPATTAPSLPTTTAPSQLLPTAPSPPTTTAPSPPLPTAPSPPPPTAPSPPPTTAPSLTPPTAPSPPPPTAPSPPPTTAPSLTPTTAPSLTPTTAPSPPPATAPSLPPATAPSLTPPTAPPPPTAPSPPPPTAPSLTPPTAPSPPPPTAPSSPPTTTPSPTTTTTPWPPLNYHYSLYDSSSAIFSSSGGVLYSPVYGVTVYIPAGAILGEEQVEVSFRLVKEEAEIQEFFSPSLFEGCFPCSEVFEIEARLVNALDGEKFTKFHSDAWIELPHCSSFGGYSLKDYSIAFVVSERRGKVEVEEQALFSEGYPYVNLPVRHFSRYCVIHTPKKKFGIIKGKNVVSHVRASVHKLSFSDSFDSDQSASPYTHCKKLKQAIRESATCSSATEKRSNFIEMKNTSNEASTEDRHQTLIRQDASDNHMEVDPPAPIQSSPVEPLPQHPPIPTTIQWERDRYVLALLSIMIPQDQLVALGESLGLQTITIEQVMSCYTAGSALKVGERAYEMFRRALNDEQPLTFSKILIGFDEIGRSKDLCPILRSYLQSGLVSHSFKMDSCGTRDPAEAECNDPSSTLFIAWLHANHPSLLPRVCVPNAAMDRAILPEEQEKLFNDLSQRMVCVWRMVGRLLGLPDYKIEAVDVEGSRSQDGECESCNQMLLKWAKHSPSDTTYYRLMTALQLTSRGVGAANDAISFLKNFTHSRMNAIALN